MARYLIIGGSGFLGTHLHAALRMARNECRILDPHIPLVPAKLVTAPFAAVPSVWIEGDTTDPDRVQEAAEGCDGIFHLAAGRPPAEPTAGLIRVAAVAARAGIPLVYGSSAAVYGTQASGQLLETSSLAPLSPEGRLLRASERAVQILQIRQQVPMLGLRFFSVYGPQPYPDAPGAGVVAVFLNRLERGLPLDIFGDGSQVRDFVYSDDAVRMLIAAMDFCQTGPALPVLESLPLPVLNVCRGQGTSLATLAATLGELLACAPLLRVRRGCPFDPPRQVGDPGQAAVLLGVRPRTRLRTGLARILRTRAQRFCPLPSAVRGGVPVSPAICTGSAPSQAGYQPQTF